jgi:ferredoxin-NADP reductase
VPTQTSIASSLLALATTFHLALAALRNHRSSSASPVSSLAAVSLLLAVLPWLFPSAVGVLGGLVGHGAWFGVCEWLTAGSRVPSPGTVSSRRPPPAQASIAAPAVATAPRHAIRSAPSSAAPPKGFVQAAVLAVIEETPSVKTIRVARPEGFEFEAGQFLTVRVRVDGKEYARCYSISSAPAARGYLEISVKRQGIVSNALHTTARPGASLSVRAPVGAFKYPSGDDRPMVLLAAGIGVTPLMSMLRHATTCEPTRPVTLIYSVHSDNDFAFHDELVSVARRHAQVRIFLAVSSRTTRGDVYPGRVDEALLRTAIPDVAHSIVFVCGPKPMIDDMRALLARLGVPEGQVRHEVFQAAVAAAAGLAEPPPTQTTRGRAAFHQMHCKRSGADVAVAAGQTLLEAAESANVMIASLCRAGICGTCRVQVIEGDVRCESTTLDEAEQRQGLVLACVTTARSDCVVNL